MPPAVYQGSSAYPSPDLRPVVTIGNFDGVHLGHRVLLSRAIAIAREHDVPACAFTFHPAPRDVLRPGNPIRRIQTLDDRVATLHRVGIDHVVVEPFTIELSKMQPAAFARQILVERLNPTAVVVGWDFRFGQARAGTAKVLGELLDVPVEQIEAQQLAGGVISSSRIRAALDAGDVHTAATLLGRPHDVVGTVVHGDARGRTIGVPTANVRARTQLLPADGVYAVVATVDGKPVRGMANLGKRPTFDGHERRLEVHLFDFEGDLYGAELRTAFVARLRGELRFDGLDALKAQLAVDATQARAALDRP